jgi:hypothetical protein
VFACLRACAEVIVAAVESVVVIIVVELLDTQKTFIQGHAFTAYLLII